jgi:hypothetical protein
MKIIIVLTSLAKLHDVNIGGNNINGVKSTLASCLGSTNTNGLNSLFIKNVSATIFFHSHSTMLDTLSEQYVHIRETTIL